MGTTRAELLRWHRTSLNRDLIRSIGHLSHAVSYSSTWIRGRHGFTYGADYRRQQFNLFSQRDPRGSFTFTGAATGNDFADFLQGIPTASSIAYGNADKYFRQWFASGFISDDWKVRPSITLTLGVRWEYESPIVEKYGRLVNLDIDPNFTSATPTIATPSDSLIRTDKTGFEPRLAVGVETASDIVVDRARRIWRVPRYDGLPLHRRSDGATGAFVAQPERAEHTGESAHSGRWLQGIAHGHSHNLRRRSGLPRGHRAELDALDSAGPARSHCNSR